MPENKKNDTKGCWGCLFVIVAAMFDLRLHYKGGEWDLVSNWEWSRLQLMRVGQSDLDEDLHGTWAEDPGI